MSISLLLIPLETLQVFYADEDVIAQRSEVVYLSHVCAVLNTFSAFPSGHFVWQVNWGMDERAI